MSASEMPLVTFITVNYRMTRLIHFLLKGVEEANISFPFEYFVVDNASHDAELAHLSHRFPWMRLIESPKNVGFGAGHNLAIKEARGAYVACLNPDLSVFPGELDRWVAWMEAHAEVGISSPRLLNPDGSDQESCYRFPGFWTPLQRRTFLGKLPWSRAGLDAYVMKDMDRGESAEVDWALGAAMLIRRDLLDRMGHFDERFFMYMEDADLCRRAWMAGSCVMYTPVAKFVHYHGRQSRVRYLWQIATNRAARYHIMSGIKYFLKYRSQSNPRMAKEEK